MKSEESQEQKHLPYEIQGVQTSAIVVGHEARNAVVNSPGNFGVAPPADIEEVVASFVDAGFSLLLDPRPGENICSGTDLTAAGFIHNAATQATIGYTKFVASFDPTAPQLYLDLWMKTGGINGAGPMKPHLRRLYETSVVMGFETFRLHAGLGDGPTYWAEAGLQFDGLGYQDVAHAALADILSVPPSLVSPITAPKDLLGYTASASITDAFATMGNVDPVNKFHDPGQLAHKTTDLSIDVISQRPVGECLLHALAPWPGYADISDPGVSDANFYAWL